MYRLLITVFLYTSSVSPAPQDSSDITYVRALSDDTQTLQSSTESSTENLPVIIAGASEETTKPVIQPEPGNPEFFSDNQDNVTQSSSQIDKETYITARYEAETTVTERSHSSEELGIPTTEVNEVKSRFPSTRFTSKLSYFKKTKDFSGSALTNLLEKKGMRKFRSRCRCEKIWNCPKLQITVPRCPDEYFLCCF